MFSFYLSTIKKNATEERENVDFLFLIPVLMLFLPQVSVLFLRELFRIKNV